MLGRSANDLFWMSRYMERAENIARLLEVGYRIALLPREGDGQDNEWSSTLRSAGSEKGYLSKHGTYATRDVVNYMLFDPDNPSACIPASPPQGAMRAPSARRSRARCGRA
jgi:uncharacterized alpha-E superfamily protein